MWNTLSYRDEMEKISILKIFTSYNFFLHEKISSLILFPTVFSPFLQMIEDIS